MRFILNSLIAVTAVFWIDISSLKIASANQSGAIVIGLDADMSSGAAEGGESIRRGAIVAIKEINDNGGILGRKMELVVRDHQGNPARGKDNILEFAEMQNLVAVLGGIHTPVALHELKDIHANKLIYLSPWAAGTPIVDNGFKPNYVFRVSVRDALAGGFMVDHAIKSGYIKLGLMFERTGWGRSNEAAVKTALSKLALKPVGLEWFNWGVADLSDEIERLSQLGAEAIILVANPREGSIVVDAMAGRAEENRLPIISHWGISGGDFFVDNHLKLQKVDLSFLQTFSFLKPPVPERARQFFEAYQRIFPDTKRPEEVLSPVGAAHAYDIIHLLAKAITRVGTVERSPVRDALEKIDTYAGLMKDYTPPFTPERHDALDVGSFIMTRFDGDGVIQPVAMK
ncbi:MAG: ABC transporter substrate-binding protein [Rhodospirillales bacterium]|nr:ABC transporter substrate-binding protein [Rhodospirillales bacterium]